MEGINEIGTKEFHEGLEGYTVVTFSVFDDQVQVVLPLMKLMGVKEYTVSSGAQSNSGWLNNQQPLI